MKRARKPWEEIRKIVLHWTGGEGNAARVERTLRRRGLGYHYVIENTGRVVQIIQDEFAAYHCGRENGWSIGVALVGYGYRWPASRRWRTPRGPRDVYETCVHGRRVYLADFFQAQKEAAFRLVEDLVAEHGIERRVPVTDCVLDPTEARVFSGVLGHYHINARKLDPGPRLIREVAAEVF